MTYYEDTYYVDSRDADPQGLCRPSTLLGFLQEAATRAAVELHVSREEMLGRYNCFWMLARMWYRLDRPLRWDEHLTVRTFHRGNKGVAMYRDFDLYQDGQSVGEAVSTWVLADLDTRKLLRLSTVGEMESTSGGELCKTILLHKVHMPSEMTLAEQRLLHYSDADINGHVNNVRYADFACDALHLERLGEGKFVSSLHISYLKECRPGEVIAMSAGEQAGTYFVRGVGEEGAARFETAVTLENIP